MARKKFYKYSKNTWRALLQYGFGIFLRSGLFRYSSKKSCFTLKSLKEIRDPLKIWADYELIELYLRVGLEQYLKSLYIKKGYLVHEFSRDKNIAKNDMFNIRKIICKQDKTVDLIVLGNQCNLTNILDARIVKKLSKVIDRIRIKGNSPAHWYRQRIIISMDELKENLKLVNYLHRNLLKSSRGIRMQIESDAAKCELLTK